MHKRRRSVGSVRAELVVKSKEAALCAIRVFNDPSVSFKSETYIVLMVIAWTYLLHAYYRSRSTEYRYFRIAGKQKRYERTRNGSYKYWELSRCLDCEASPIDRDTANNLRFLIGLRHEIEHQMTRSLDSYLSGRYQACALNYNDCLKRLFGAKHGLDQHLAYTIQFTELSNEQLSGPSPEIEIPERLRAYIAQFDASLSGDQLNSSRFSYRLLFTRKLANRPGQADRVIEFIKPDSELGQQIEKQYWVKQEVERPKFRATDVVKAVQAAGFSRFRIAPQHVSMWRNEDAKNPGKGYGVNVQGTWYWYQAWVDRCIALCTAAGDEYR
jgi:hypothetical protein